MFGIHEHGITPVMAERKKGKKSDNAGMKEGRPQREEEKKETINKKWETTLTASVRKQDQNTMPKTKPNMHTFSGYTHFKQQTDR